MFSLVIVFVGCQSEHEHEYGDWEQSEHEHEYGDWEYDSIKHYKFCDCGEIWGEAPHDVEDGVCSVCGNKEWQEDKWILTFMIDEGIIYQSIEVFREEIISIPENPKKDGCIFGGWYWDEGIWKKPFTLDSLLSVPISSNMKIFAKWIEIHNHDFSQQNMAYEYLKTAANCMAGAVYYYSCSCGEKGSETFDGGGIGNHKFVEYGACVFCKTPYFTQELCFYENNNGGLSVYADWRIDNEIKIVIPNKLNGKLITIIDDRGFYNCQSIISVVIPDSVTLIGEYAFCNCRSLDNIIMGNSVSKIGKNAFIGCSALKSISIPNGVAVIEDETFLGCTSLTSVKIGESVTSIGDYAFANCRSLTSVYYMGTASEWSNIIIGIDNDGLKSATRYYYSQTEPTESGNYWHYDTDGKTPVVWKKEN